MDNHDFWKTLDMTFLLENIPGAVLVMDTKRIIRYFNRAARALFKLPDSTGFGITCSEMTGCTGKHNNCLLINSLKSGEEVNNLEMPIKAGNESRFISVSTKLLYNSNNELVGQIELLKDLAGIKELPGADIDNIKFPTMVGNSKAMKKIFSIISSVAKSKSTVLIEGESGTGKELVAKAIHEGSSRRNEPFVAINCALLSENLLESEMFGHSKGAFTGAFYNKPGKFEFANGGTIFLDEIGDMPFSIQAKLLRAIQEEKFERIGSNQTISVDVRVIAATNKELLKEVNKGNFREDLFYRIRVFPIKLPPLRNREGDIPLLVRFCMEKFNNEMGKNINNVSHKAMDILMAYDYPGNIREIENIIEYAFVCCDGNTILLEHLPKELISNEKELLDNIGENEGAIENLEREMIIRMLNQPDRNFTDLSKKLGISRTTLWRKMKKYKLKV